MTTSVAPAMMGSERVPVITTQTVWPLQGGYGAIVKLLTVKEVVPVAQLVNVGD